MKDIEEILQTYAKEEIEVPQKVQYRVKYTLKNKTKSKTHYILKNFATSVATLILVLVSSVSVYAACGGTIEGKTIIEWLGIKIFSEYEDYKIDIEGKKLSNKETSINLVGATCDDGFTILEFDIKIGQEHKEKLQTEQKDIYVSFNNKFITDETGTYLDTINNYSIIIDKEEYWIRPRAAQSIVRISENEYKLYQLYFLTNKEVQNKKEFELTLRDIVICTIKDEDTYVPIEGQIDVKVSKEKTLENTKIIDIKDKQIKYKNMTIKANQIIDTPLQTIIKIKTTYENVSLQSLTNSDNKDFIGTIVYEAENENGKNLSAWSYETNRKITYKDGRTEEWEQGDIGTSEKFTNAKMETEGYIIIEKDKYNSKIKIMAKDMIDRIQGKEYRECGDFSVELN